MKKVKQSIKNRFFGDTVDTGGVSIDKWLEKSVKRLLSVKDKHPIVAISMKVLEDFTKNYTNKLTTASISLKRQMHLYMQKN